MEKTPPSEISVTMAEQAESQKVEETLNPNAHDKSQNSDEATLESDSSAPGGTESTITNHSAAETSAPASDADRENSLEYADELMERGHKAIKEDDFGEAAENFSRALEIRLNLYFFGCCQMPFLAICLEFNS